MMDNNDKLISQFMLAHKQDIADNGFSRQVIQRLPTQAKWLSDVLTVACTIVCCTLFYVFHGLDFIFGAINETITSQSYYWMSNANTQSLWIAVVVLIILGMQRICSIKW